jgi:hypothetical protein
MVISQLRALESAPALLFTQFQGLLSEGYATGEKDANGLYVGLKPAQVGFKCFDLREKDNKEYFVLPNHNDDCWSEPRWVAMGRANEKHDHGYTGRDFCHYIGDGTHNVWCYDPGSAAPWHVEDFTGLPIAMRGAPSMSMRNVLWPNRNEIPRNILQVWNGCGHPVRCSLFWTALKCYV